MNVIALATSDISRTVSTNGSYFTTTMSTFRGLFKEFPLISADRFDGENLSSKVFLLSHCHSDHMVGLQEIDELPGPLYTSEISAVFVRKQFPSIQDIRILEIESPVEITFKAEDKKYYVTVTTYSAKHCPGSVMLLIESKEHKVLYTGDFRLTTLDLDKSFSSLKCSSLDTVYLDSTFLNKDYMEFPLQLESITTICDLIKEWTTKSKNHIINIECPAQYGYEYLFMEITRRLKHKIFVGEQQWLKYLYLPEMDACISNKITECQVRIMLKSWKKFNPDPSVYCVRVIRPSAIFWRCWKRGDKFVSKENNEVYRVAYSNHSSCSEIKDFLEFLKPQSVKLNVLPGSKKYAEEMKMCLNDIFNDTKSVISNSDAVKVIKFENLFAVSSNGYRSEKRDIRLPMKRIKL